MNPYRAYANADNIDDQNKPRLLLKVYQTLLDKIDMVKTATRSNNFEKKYEELTKVTMILEILDSALDMSQGEISKNLSELYRYLVRRLITVHASRDLAVLDECRSLISEINEGFVGAFNKEMGVKPKIQDAKSAQTGPRAACMI